MLEEQNIHNKKDEFEIRKFQNGCGKTQYLKRKNNAMVDASIFCIDDFIRCDTRISLLNPSNSDTIIYNKNVKKFVEDQNAM